MIIIFLKEIIAGLGFEFEDDESFSGKGDKNQEKRRGKKISTS